MTTLPQPPSEQLLPVESRPWFREPLVWLLVGIPAAALVAGAVTVFLAIHGADVELPHSQ